LSAAALLHVAVASFSHFVMKDLSAAPASFLSVACASQVGLSAGGVWPFAAVAASKRKAVAARYFMAHLREWNATRATISEWR
jgi:hypothetical protein